MGTLKPKSNGPLYNSTMIGTLAVDGWTVTFGTARMGLGGLRPRPVPSSLYQMQQPTHQRPVYQLRIIRRGTMITLARRVKQVSGHRRTAARYAAVHVCHLPSTAQWCVGTFT